MELVRSLYRNCVVALTALQSPPGGKNKLWRRLSGHSWVIILTGVFLISSLWLFTREQLAADYERTMAEAATETMNLAVAFEENVRRIVTAADDDLLALKSIYEQEGLSGPSFAAFAAMAATDPARAQVAVCDERGVNVWSTAAAVVGTSRADRDYFRAHRGADTGALYIGRVVESRVVSRQVIPLSRRIAKPDGSFGGIVYTGIKVDYFLSFYERINLGQDQMITLTGLDGFSRVRKSGDKVDTDRDIRNGTLWKNVAAGLGSGTFATSALMDGVRRLNSFRVLPEYPLVATVAKSNAVVLASFEQHRQRYLLAAWLLSLFVAAICGLLVARQERMLRREESLETLVAARTRELQAANAKLSEQAKLLELARDYIIVRDLDGRVIYWNKGAEAGYGWPAGEATGQVTHTLLKTQFPATKDLVMHRLLTEGHWEGELVHTRKDGERIVVQSNQTLYRDAAGNPVSILEINHDITEQKKYADHIERLDRLNIVGEMAAGIGHEVRNPMTTVRGYLQQFARKAAFAEFREAFALMIEELDRANDIISEFLSLAKNKTVILKQTNLNTVIRNLFPLLQADALRRGSTVELELADIPEVVADEKEMRQCILNLVGNGLDATPRGGKVTVATAREGNRVVMTVRDHGAGIAPEILGKLWTPFFTTKEHGTGLGLSVCYRIAQSHQATIEVDTGPKGTAFHFIFQEHGRAG